MSVLARIRRPLADPRLGAHLPARYGRTMTSTDYFDARLRHETDPSDVYAAQRAGERFVLVDVRGDEAWQQGRVTGAVHLPYRQIADRARQEIPLDTPVVVYCWSPGCNAGVRGAREFAALGYEVREMIGGYEYWVREGQPVENDEGPLPRTFDPLVMVVRAPVG
jgi:rhodanese-related sulfurtransferase